MTNFVKKKLPMPQPTGGSASLSPLKARRRVPEPNWPSTTLPPKSPPAAQPSDDEDEKVEIWDIDRLYPHPLQAVHFDHEADADFENLVEDIRLNGQRDPCGILPCGAVIDGERRRRVLIRLGRNQVKVIVKHKLAAAGKAAVELYMITSNTSRRQLTMLAQARLYLRTRDLQEQLGLSTGRGKSLEEFAKRIRKSGRTLDRYCELLQYPKELQDAVDRKQLPLVKALQLMKLTPAEFEPVLQLLREGENVRKVVSRLGLGFKRSPVTPKKLARYLRDWIRLTAQVEKHREEIAPLVLRHQKRWLTTVQSLGAELLAASEEVAEEKVDDDDELVEDVEVGGDELEECDDAE